MKATRYFLFAALLSILLGGCKTIGGGVVVHAPGPSTHQDLPPAHAPAHGRRAQQRYHYQYFPDAQVYFDLNRQLYFYISDNRWKVGITLPDYFRLRLGDARISLELDTDKPYRDFQTHKQKYPPGQAKQHKKDKHKDKKDKKDKGKGKGKNKSHDNDQ